MLIWAQMTKYGTYDYSARQKLSSGTNWDSEHARSHDVDVFLISSHYLEKNTKNHEKFDYFRLSILKLEKQLHRTATGASRHGSCTLPWRAGDPLEWVRSAYGGGAVPGQT